MNCFICKKQLTESEIKVNGGLLPQFDIEGYELLPVCRGCILSLGHNEVTNRAIKAQQKPSVH